MIHFKAYLNSNTTSRILVDVLYILFQKTHMHASSKEMFVINQMQFKHNPIWILDTSNKTPDLKLHQFK